MLLGDCRGFTTSGGASAQPGVGIEERLLDDDRRTVVADGIGMIETRGIEVRGRRGPLTERRAKRADRIRGANVPCVEPKFVPVIVTEVPT